MDSPAAVFHFLKGFVTPKNDPNDLSVIDLQVGRQVHRNVPGNMRTELWLSVLHRGRIGDGYVAQYRSMLAKGVSEQVHSDIEKDVGRTFPGSPRFTTPEGQRSLLNVLQAYAAFDEEVNYCQGMNFLAALMLTWLPWEAEAFGALVLVMKDRGLRELYKSDMQMLQARLWQVGKVMPQKLARHMEDHLAIPVLYASSWLLTAFASDFPIFFASRVMDIILTDRYMVAIMKVVVGILKRCEARLLEMRDMEKMVAFLRMEVPQWRHDTLQEVLTAALASEWTPKQALILERTENVESVVDAVQRVASHLPQDDTADDAVEDEGEDQPSHARKDSKLANFTWASKLSNASSTGASAVHPGLLQSLTGTIAGLPTMISDAAHNMSSNVSSNIGDLLGLSEEKPQHSIVSLPPRPSGHVAAQQHALALEERPGEVSTDSDAVGDYLAALSLAASNSSGDAPSLVKRLNTCGLDPASLAGGAACPLSHAISSAPADAESSASGDSRGAADRLGPCSALQARNSSNLRQLSTGSEHSGSADFSRDPFRRTADAECAAVVCKGFFSPSLHTGSVPSSPFKQSDTLGRHNTDIEHRRIAASETNSDLSDLLATASKGSFSSLQQTGGVPSSPFQQSTGSSQLPDLACQPQQDERRPPERYAVLQGRRRSSLNRKSGGALASHQSLGGPSDSFMSWGSFHSPEEQHASASNEIDGVKPSDTGLLSMEYSDAIRSPIQTEGQEGAPEHVMHSLSSAASTASRRSELGSSKQDEHKDNLLDIADAEQDHRHSSAAEDPFRQAHREAAPAAKEQQVVRKHGAHRKKPSLSQWELQQLSGFAVSTDGSAQASPMRTACSLQHPT